MTPEDLQVDRERIEDCIRLGERMSPHFAMDLLERIQGLEAHVALLKASLKQMVGSEERVRQLEGALGGVLKWCHQGHGGFPIKQCGLCSPALRALNPQPAEGTGT